MFHVKHIDHRQATFPVGHSTKNSWRGRARRALHAIPPGTEMTFGELQTLLAAAGIEQPPEPGNQRPWTELLRDGMRRRILRRMALYRDGERVYRRRTRGAVGEGS